MKYTYKIIDKIFENHTTKELLDTCIDNGTFDKFLDRLSQLTGEPKRSRRTIPEHGEIATEAQIDIKHAAKEKSEPKEKTKEEKKKEKKGIGYTTGTGSAWNVQEYLDSKDAKNSQISNIINILMHSIKSTENDPFDFDAEPNDENDDDQTRMKDLLLESALLPILEAALRSGSLLEMAKEIQLYNSYLDLIAGLS